MDKNAIKKYAVWARRELISRVSQRAALYGITEKNTGNPSDDSVGGKVLTSVEKKERQALIAQINSKGYEEVMEEVAYTWFNRFSALRFMEVNGYLPSHVRVFTDDDNAFKPQILTEAINLEIDGIDMEKVYALKNANDNDELFKYLIIVQCNALSEILPGMFQKIEDYTELLFPDNLLRQGSVVERLIIEIPETSFDISSEDGQIEIIGWLYQYYISEKHEEVVDPLHGKVVKKEEVPAATQLFTTDWVVKYIVDNSVGRYWIENNPNSMLENQLEYYVPSTKVSSLESNVIITPQEVTVFDPCVGSGHFLVYAFDVLMKIYNEYGYNEREAVSEIVTNNIYGLDIDARAVQLAYFAVMMKARQYDRRFFNRGIQPHIYEIVESNDCDTLSINYFINGDSSLKHEIDIIMHVMEDSKEYGSILQIPEIDFEKIRQRFTDLNSENSIFINYLQTKFKSIIDATKVLAGKYAVVVTNPPYLNKYDAKLKDYIINNYKDYSGDLFSVFMYRNFMFCKESGYTGFMTPFVWMFIQTYEKLRNYIVKEKNLSTLIQMEYSAYEEATVPICSFVLKNQKSFDKALCFRLSDFKGGMQVQKEKVLYAISNKECGYFYESDKRDFLHIPGCPIAYWITKKVVQAFSNQLISNIAFSDGQILTGNNKKYLHYLWEVNAVDVINHSRWALHAKGGEYRRWYGNIDTVVSWTNESIAHYKKDKIARFPKQHILFREGITWSLISSSDMFGMRWLSPDTTFNKAAATILFNDESLIPYVLGYLNSVVARTILKMLNPTLNTNIKDILALPIIIDNDCKAHVEKLVKENISISKEDWDSFETSWEFKKHPLIKDTDSIENAYEMWEKECDRRYITLKRNEEEINSIFIELYDLRDELICEVQPEDVTVKRADLNRDIRSLISYSVGCMMGRYSLDKDGIIYAGGNWNEDNYSSFDVDKDNILPICNDDYFEDDITGRFIKWVEVVYGKDTLEENLSFIAYALGGKGSSRDVIRNYFINEFYADHLKNYQKCPIYWLFDSGKKKGFKCLIYMHRYKTDTIARIRTDYVHEQQSRYRTEITDFQNRMNNASTGDRVKLSKKLKTLQDQAEELRVYEEKIHHFADQMINIDLDDGVTKNYAKFKEVLAKIK